MGRPLNKKYFGNKNAGDPLTTSDDYGIGGNGVLSVAVATPGTAYSQGVATFVSAPNVPRGVQAVVKPVVTVGTGVISSFTVIDGGSGYTAAPTVTLLASTTVIIAATGVSGTNVLTLTPTTGIFVGQAATGINIGASAVVTAVNTGNVVVSVNNSGAVASNVTFSGIGTGGVVGAVVMTTTANAGFTFPTFSISANVAGVSALQGDIVKQSNAHRFRVTTADGTAVVSLANTAPVSGQLRLTAVDSAGGTYFIDKLNARKATITAGTGTQFSTGTKVPWNISAAVANTSIKINTI